MKLKVKIVYLTQTPGITYRNHRTNYIYLTLFSEITCEIINNKCKTACLHGC